MQNRRENSGSSARLLPAAVNRKNLMQIGMSGVPAAIR